MMRRRSVILGTVAAMIAVVVLSSGGTAAAQSRASGIPVPVTAVTATGATLDGTLTIRRFTARNDQVFAVGTLDGAVEGIGMITSEPVRVTVQRIESSCQHFRFVLGPVNVEVSDMSGLLDDAIPADMDELRAGITADQDDTGFLEPFLCGIAGLIGGDGDIDVRAGELPVTAETLARIMNRALILFR